MSKAEILRLPDYLGHIQEAIERIHHYVDDLDEIAFLDDEKTWEAVIRNFEIEVAGMPNNAGVGFVDYVLWGDDELALIEAKRTRRDEQQAKLYADCLEAQYS